MNPPLILLPLPRRLELRSGRCGGSTLRLVGNVPVDATHAAKTLATSDAGVVDLKFAVDHSTDQQGYRLVISENGVVITAQDGAGFHFAVQTLRQIKRQSPVGLPHLEIADHPDFPTRGVMLDISRDKVPTMATLFRLIDLLAEWKINQLQLYIEHTFAYIKHRTVWENASPMTAEEIRELDDYCRERFIELVPNQNSFGHMERWLKHAEYQHLAEAIDGAQTPWGFRWKGPFSLCPTDPASIEFLRGLYAELLPNFSSKLFNVGCDETFDIGQGRSKSECEAHGVTTVYLEFLHRVNDLVAEHGRRMMFWGDIIVQKPELITQLPKNVIAMEWGYEADHPFDRDGKYFAEAKIPFYICPGTSSWNSIAGRTYNAVANLRSAAENGLKHGAIGYLITDWGDNGHLQYLPMSYLGFAAGAAFSWCLESNRRVDLTAALNLHAFDDPTGVLGRAALELGNVYQVCGKPNHNGSTLFRILVPPPNDAHPEAGLKKENLDRSETAVRAALREVSEHEWDSLEKKLIGDELSNAGAILIHAINLGRARLGFDVGQQKSLTEIVAEHRRLWLSRNRPGGLEDSVSHLRGMGVSPMQ